MIKAKHHLIGGTKVLKSHIRIEAYGTVDELNSYIGLLGDQFQHDHTTKSLREIQDRLFTIGSSLACDPDKEPLLKIPDLKEEDVQWLENEIDFMNAVLVPMKSFILPGGHVSISTAHVVTLCLQKSRTKLCTVCLNRNCL